MWSNMMFRSEACVNVTTGGWKVSKHGAKRPQKPYGLLGMGRRGERDGGGGGGGRDIIYLLLHCHYQSFSCIKVGSDESHFNVSVGSDGQSHKTVSTNHNLF